MGNGGRRESGAPLKPPQPKEKLNETSHDASFFRDFVCFASISAITHKQPLGVNSQHQIWHLDNAQWNQIQGPSGAVVTQVSAASDGTAWALDQNANIYSYTGSGWQQMPGQFTRCPRAAPRTYGP